MYTTFFFFNDTATTEIYTLSLHDALPISSRSRTVLPRHPSTVSMSMASGYPERHGRAAHHPAGPSRPDRDHRSGGAARSEEHTSELQSRQYLVCRLLLEKKKTN